MTTARSKRVRTALLLAGACFLTAQLVFRLLPGMFETWNLKAVDQLFLLRAAIFDPVYDGTVVHLDLNNTSILKLNNFYTSRSDHARVIRNLSAMGTSALLYDYIFAARTEADDDAALIEATRDAGNVYYGMAFRLTGPGAVGGAGNERIGEQAALDRTAWEVDLAAGGERLYVGTDPLTTFRPLAEASRGLGFVNIPIDRDGVFRRMPLLVRYNDAFYPAIGLRLVCDFLGVPPKDVVLEPGRSITLKGARRPGAPGSEDIRIPVDDRGSMWINFPGPWGRMTHYNFADVWLASGDREEMALWKEELNGKIVVVSDVLTGSSDVGPVPTDPFFPLSGCHSAALNTILSGEFLKELSTGRMLWIEFFLLMGMVFMAVRLPAMGFVAGGTVLAAVYIAVAIGCFLYANLILHLVRPLMSIFFSLLVIQVAHAIDSARLQAETERARDRAERDLEIGRKIQSGFFPETIEQPEGWEIAARFQAARQVAGDFYDVFPLGGDGKVAFLISDVCDKGVGAALFMALFRSLVRAFAAQQTEGTANAAAGSDAAGILLGTIRQTNNYIARTHSRANMFATAFFGVLTPGSGEIHYINCGHEAPLVIGPNQVRNVLRPTGPAIGAFPDLVFNTARVCLAAGEVLFAFTDGATDAQDPGGKFFTRERLIRAAVATEAAAEERIGRILSAIEAHMGGAPPFDDITVLVVRRTEVAQKG